MIKPREQRLGGTTYGNTERKGKSLNALNTPD